MDAGDTAIRWRRRIVRPVVRRSLWSVEKILKNDYIAKDAHTKADRARVASASSRDDDGLRRLCRCPTYV